MMIIALMASAAVLAVWLGLGLLVLALCRMSASGDGRSATQGATVATPQAPRTIAPGLTVWEPQVDIDFELRKMILKGRAVRAHGARFVPGS